MSIDTLSGDLAAVCFDTPVIARPVRTLVVAIYSPWAPTTYTYTYNADGLRMTKTVDVC